MLDENTGRRRALRLYPAPLGPCEECRAFQARFRHHRNGDTADNERSNLAFLCGFCHQRHHAVSRWRRR